jgi:probable rRNA maturation factor
MSGGYAMLMVVTTPLPCYYREIGIDSRNSTLVAPVTPASGSPLVHISVDEEFDEMFELAPVESAASEAIARELVKGPNEATISITNDAELQRLNLQFRGADKPTDMLSFGSEDAHNGTVPTSDPEFISGPDESPSLGEVIISFDQAKRQADIAGRPVEHELALLATHGILHLLGFDHADAVTERDMFARTDRILEAVLGADAMPIMPVMDSLDDIAAAEKVGG